MNTIHGVLALIVLAAAGCTSEAATTSTLGGGGAGGAGTTAGAGGGAGGAPMVVDDVRGDRYCEVLLGHVDGAMVHVEVYTTYGLSDCPDDAWKALDSAAIKVDTSADAVILNGPRYWLMDRFESTALIDPTPVTFGALTMRLAGTLDVAITEVMGGSKPYVPRTVARTTSWVYDAGKKVYELVDPQGKVFDMQSYSVQTTPQTEDSLADLGAVLSLPSGWMFRSRTLDSALTVTAVDGMATVVQDERQNTYQLSQQ